MGLKKSSRKPFTLHFNHQISFHANTTYRHKMSALWTAAFMGIWAGTRINREALKMKRRKQLPERANVTKQDLYCMSIAYNIGNMTGYQSGVLEI